MNRPTDEPVDPQVRGVGVLFIASGLCLFVLMVFATLFSLGRLRLIVPAVAWRQLFMAHYCGTVLSGAVYLWLSYRKNRRVPTIAILEFISGIVLLPGFMFATGTLLVRQLLWPWFSLTPAALLIGYGLRLLGGRPLWKLPQL